MSLFSNAGVFPLTSYYVKEWSKLYLESLTNSTSIIMWSKIQIVFH